MRLCIVGNPENRRVRDFQAAAGRIGFPTPECVSWRELLDEPRAALVRLATTDMVRLDSPGEDDGVLQRLVQLGGGEGGLAFGEIGFLHEQYQGFRAVLDRLCTLATPFQNSPAEVKVMFDKWASHARFAAAGLARPATWLAPTTVESFRELRSEYCSTSSGRLFLKPRYASSASGVCAYRWSRDREQLIAPIEIQQDRSGVRLYNSLRIRRYTSFEQIDAILGRLLPQGMVCESWIRKAWLPDGQFDLRIVVIGGEARHVVVRRSHYPMTNLHLGNQRGSVDEVCESFGRRVLDMCKRLAERAAACFPDSLYAGVDVLVRSKAEPLVCEINAFGDLLPNVTHRGETTYEAILRSSPCCSTASHAYQT
ncbi:MAG: STM4014 family protein [Pirellulales bacterium]|nr:STM4014 family protein [Pirellulales bacterium]